MTSNEIVLPEISVDQDRLWQTYVEMSKIGATENGGVCRLALTDEDKEGRDLFVTWCREAGCEILVDQMGNVFARRRGKSNELPPVVTGSHNDTQPNGGRFDGTYGVLAGLEVIRTLNDAGIETMSPIEVVLWTNEEGVRFRPPMIASAVYAGVFDLDFGLSREDKDGKTIGQELERIGYAGDVPIGREIGAYFEAHIEQGPVLEAEGKEIGVVTGILGIRAYEVTLTGQESHSGPTPMDRRKDAFVGVSKICVAVHELARRFDPEARITVGQCDISPNAPSVIPGKAVFTIDCRHPTMDGHEQLSAEITKICEDVSQETGLRLNMEVYWYFSCLQFHEGCVSAVRRAAQRREYSHREIASGAGHDAVHINGIAPTGMVFIPCENGLSHNEAENISPSDAAAGCNVLMDAILEFAVPV